jgi:hypothetical protein
MVQLPFLIMTWSTGTFLGENPCFLLRNRTETTTGGEGLLIEDGILNPLSGT